VLFAIFGIRLVVPKALVVKRDMLFVPFLLFLGFGGRSSYFAASLR
jgi:hypothetical protein